MSATRHPMHPYRVVEAIEHVDTLDRLAETVEPSMRRMLRSGGTTELTTGTWLGHSVHPLLTDVPLGTWMSATVLDLLGPQRFKPASEVLLAVGLLASVPTVVTGWSEWLDAQRGAKRVGLVHAAANNTAITLYAASLVAKLRGRVGRGVAYGVAGGVVSLIGGYIGGHLSFGRGVGMDQSAPVPLPPVTRVSMPPGEIHDPLTVSIADVEVLLVPERDRLSALISRCTRCGGALVPATDGSVACPGDGSRFRPRDGTVLRGPASVPARTLEVSWEADGLELRAETGGRRP